MRAGLGQFELAFKMSCPANLVVFRFLNDPQRAYDIIAKVGTGAGGQSLHLEAACCKSHHVLLVVVGNEADEAAWCLCHKMLFFLLATSHSLPALPCCQAAEEDALVVYTLVSTDIIKSLRTACQLYNVPCVDLWSPLLDSMELHLQSVRKGVPLSSVDRRSMLSGDYFRWGPAAVASIVYLLACNAACVSIHVMPSCL